MPGIKHCLATAVLLLGACGGGSGTGVDGGPGAGGCSCLDTLVAVMEGCQPSGTCIEQAVGTTAANVCYSNGVKIRISVTSLPTDAMSMTMSVKKGAVCYSMVMTETESGDMTMVFKNGTGATIATLGTNENDERTVTCPGGSPSVITSACSTQASSAGTLSNPPTTDCTTGTCNY